ncbi:hypothetical protein ACFOYZ_29990, partial [Neobacillus cucumis]|uniref:hypothetical protein n=1 Tax=Neobacillus cucumis TaxID=1740721 RepID=UPI0036241634
MAKVQTEGDVSLVEILPKTTGLWCVDSFHEDCSKSKCCQDMGFQCFQKNASFAACLKTCDKNASWSCKALSNKTRCASVTENCQEFGCCADSAHQCYQKNKNWGSCMTSCNPAVMQARDSLKEPWSCDPIGPVNSLDYTVDYTVGVYGDVEVEPW